MEGVMMVSKLFFFFRKKPNSNHFRLRRHIVSVVTTKICCDSMKAKQAIVNKWVELCSNKTWFTKTGSIWPVGHILPALPKKTINDVALYSVPC